MRVSLSRMSLLAVCLPVVAAIAACSQPPAPAPAPKSETPVQSPVERGKYLVTTGLRNDCHTPKKMGPNGPEPDMDLELSGHPEGMVVKAAYTPAKNSPWIVAGLGSLTAWSGPWGVSFTANLTPDPNTGLRSGVWTEELFIKALRTGKHMGTGRDILPPMPWQFIGQYSDADLKAIWAYLGTIKPIKNHVPDPIPPVTSR